MQTQGWYNRLNTLRRQLRSRGVIVGDLDDESNMTNTGNAARAVAGAGAGATNVNMSPEGRRRRHAAAANARIPPTLNPTRKGPISLIAQNSAPDNLMSHLNAEHSKGGGFLGFLGGNNQRRLAAASRGLSHAVRQFELEDYHNPIPADMSLATWHTAHPRAKSANVAGRRLKQEDLIFLRGIEYLNMSGCRLAAPFNMEAFENLREINTLNISDCVGINHWIFPHIAGVKNLIMSNCKHISINDASFSNLRGIKELDIDGCTQAGLTDGAFEQLAGLEYLSMRRCTQFTDAALEGLDSIKKLIISNCPEFTGETFPASLKILEINECAGIEDDNIARLTGLEELYMGGCVQITNAAFENLGSLKTLAMDGCTGVTDAAFNKLKNVEVLNMDDCPQITPAALTQANLPLVKVITTEGCSPEVIAAAEALVASHKQAGGRRSKSKSKSKKSKSKSKSKTRRIR
jgi:hypothetical protein